MNLIAFVLLCGIAAGENPDVDRWISELGHPRYSVREMAAKKLWEAGVVAEPALRKAANSGDPEVARRARHLIEMYDWGIQPTTPREVVTLVGNYRGGDEEGKRQAIRELIQVGRPAFAAISRLATRSDAAGEKAIISEALAAAVPDALIKHIRGGDLIGAEELLDVCLVSDAIAIVDHYVAVVMLSGRLPHARTLWETRRAQRHPRAVDVSFALARAAGDEAAARGIAAIANRPELVEQVLWDVGDWKALANREMIATAEQPHSAVQALALKAYLQRLAADRDGLNKSLEGLSNLKENPEEPRELWVAAAGLMANERTAEALSHLTGPDVRSEKFAVLFARGDYKPALALAEIPPANELLERRQASRIQFAMAYAQLGQLELATPIFESVAQDANAQHDSFRLAYILRIAKLVGLTQFAHEQAAKFLEGVGDPTPEGLDVSANLLERLMPNFGPEAAVWWRFLRSVDESQSPADRLKRVITALSPDGDKNSVSEPLAAAFRRYIADASPQEQVKGLNALAVACTAANQPAQARQCYREAIQKVDHFPTRMRLADFEREQHRLSEAAEAYRAAGELQPSRSLPVYMQARCLLDAGRSEEGQAIAEKAFRLSVGKYHERLQVADELTRRGLLVEARREWAFVARAVGCRDHYAPILLEREAHDAVARRDYAQAANLYERAVAAMLRFGRTDVSEIQSHAQQIRLMRAHAELAKNHFAESLAHANACLDIQPIQVSVPIQLTSELVKHGRKADADALYERVTNTFRKCLKEFPESPMLLNNLAWCAACCRRDLKDALVHARRATELQPSLPGYWDTLAEVNHQLGGQSNAVAAIKRAIQLDGTRSYYKAQLRRMEAGDRDTPPAESEE